jgi:hypothetical protein
MWYIEFKEVVVTYVGLERDALHIHGALLIYIVSMGIFRQSRRSRLPWLVVLAAALLNEAVDLLAMAPYFNRLIAEATIKDIWNTMLWPTVLLLVGRNTDWFEKRQPASLDEQRV